MVKYSIIITTALLVSIINLFGNDSKPITTKQQQMQLSFCERLDSVIHEQKVDFKHIKGRLYDQENDR